MTEGESSGLEASTVRELLTLRHILLALQRFSIQRFFETILSSFNI